MMPRVRIISRLLLEVIVYDNIVYRNLIGEVAVDWEVEFYQKLNGEIPVLEFLLSLNEEMRAKAYSEFELLQLHGPNLTMKRGACNEQSRCPFFYRSRGIDEG